MLSLFPILQRFFPTAICHVAPLSGVLARDCDTLRPVNASRTNPLLGTATYSEEKIGLDIHLLAALCSDLRRCGGSTRIVGKGLFDHLIQVRNLPDKSTSSRYHDYSQRFQPTKSELAMNPL